VKISRARSPARQSRKRRQSAGHGPDRSEQVRGHPEAGGGHGGARRRTPGEPAAPLVTITQIRLTPDGLGRAGQAEARVGEGGRSEIRPAKGGRAGIEEGAGGPDPTALRAGAGPSIHGDPTGRFHASFAPWTRRWLFHGGRLLRGRTAAGRRSGPLSGPTARLSAGARAGRCRSLRRAATISPARGGKRGGGVDLLCM